MKACVLKDKNNIVYEDVETPSPKKGEVLVKSSGMRYLQQ